MRLPLILALALMAACSGAAPPPSALPASGSAQAAAAARASPAPAPSLVVQIDERWTYDEAARALGSAAEKAGLRGDCGLVWGAVRPTDTMCSVRALWSDLWIDGWLACGRDLDAVASPCGTARAACNPTLRDVLLVGWRAGKLVGAHPSDTGDAADLDATAAPPDSWHYLLLLSMGKDTPAKVLSRLATVAPGYIVVVPVDAAGEAGP